MKPRLTFLTASSDTFFKDFIPHLKEDFEVKVWYRETFETCCQILHDTDIAWFEWCDQFTENMMRSAKFCKYVVRLHSYEFFTPVPAQVDWSKVDKLVFVSKVLRDFSVQKFQNIPRNICEYIPNGVDTDKYQIPDGKKYNKKIAFVGYMNYKKGPQLLLDCFNAIYNYDPTFEFHIAGEHQDERIDLWFNNIQRYLPYKIYWDGWQENMPEYLIDKDFIINTSLFESQCMALQEGMASGVVPLVHAWIGAEGIYPNNHLFVNPDQCVNIVRNFDTEKNQDRVRRSMRKRIVEEYSADRQIKQVVKLLKGLV